MANIKKDYYSSDFKNKQIFYYSGLPEKQQRHFLGMEYERLGNRSRTYISEIFKCSRNRIISACEELRSLREANELPEYIGTKPVIHVLFLGSLQLSRLANMSILRQDQSDYPLYAAQHNKPLKQGY